VEPTQIPGFVFSWIPEAAFKVLPTLPDAIEFASDVRNAVDIANGLRAIFDRQGQLDAQIRAAAPGAFAPVATASTNFVRPIDPNDILGPAGFGDAHWVGLNSTLAYRIRFENVATATGAAQEIRISQMLDADLDWRTFRLGDFGLSDVYVNVGPNASFYYGRIDARASRGIDIDVTAGIDLLTGEVFWIFSAVDPLTGLAPVDPLVGILPPNVNVGEGEGFADYVVKSRVAAANGARIDARATIIFDTQAPIDTPAIFNTIDAQAPNAAVQPLPVVGAVPTFAVSWTGSENSEGSGLSTYSIYYSENGRTFQPWILGTTLTSSTFVGQAGSSYQFYAIASDNAGNTEAVPAQADAAIFIGSVSISWDGEAGDDQWANPVNWTGDRLPGLNDDVFIDASSAVRVSDQVGAVRSLISYGSLTIDAGADLTVSQLALFAGLLTVQGGVLRLEQNATLAGELQWSGGTITGAGTLLLDQTGSVFLTGPGAKHLGVDTTNRTQINWSGSGLLILDESTLINDTAGVIVVTQISSLESNSGGSGFVNAGLVVIRDVGSWAIGAGIGWSNTGRIDVATGYLAIEGDGTSTGEIRMSAGTVLRLINGESQFIGPITGSGALIVLDGTHTFAALVASSVDIRGGTLHLTGPARATGITFTAGTFVLGSRATVSITGNYVQAAGTSLVVEVGADGAAGSIIATGTVSLNGSLTLVHLDGFDPSLGFPLYAIDVVRGSGRSGEFADYFLPSTLAGAYQVQVLANRISIVFNFADFNADGGVDGNDIEAFFIAWENGDLWADFNGDGGIDGADLEIFFAMWERGGR
jgi:hypothetical protein